MLLGDDKEQESACVGYLVRTKPEDEVDGGVCKGVAVLDSILLIDQESPGGRHTAS